MKPKFVFLCLFLIGLAAAGGWLAATHFSHTHDSNSAAQTGGRKIRFYQCSMHPQVKSDQPGKCPICGMDLSPIFEGQGALSENLIALDSNSISVINVQVEIVKRRPLSRTLRVAGMIDDDETKHRIISAYIDGRIEKLFVNYLGAEVTRGQPLAAFYSPNLLSAQREYLVLAQQSSTNASENFQQEQQRLFHASRQRLRRLGLTDEQIDAFGKTNVAVLQTQIVSPMSGTVVQRFVYEGQYVKEGEKLFEIADFSTMWFRFDAYENDLALLKIGQGIEVSVPSVPNKSYSAKISFIDPNINDPTRSAKVRVEIANPLVEESGKTRRELLHRLYAEGIVRLNFAEALVVPRGAVLNPGGEPMVYVEKASGNYEPRKIKLGSFGDEGWQVLEGLSEGERVVTSGNLLIDAQAQFNRGGSAEEMAGAPANARLPDVKNDGTNALTEAQQNAAKEFFSLADALAKSLAADDLKSFQAHAQKLPAALKSFSGAFSEAKSWQPSLHKIEASARWQTASDIQEARKSFLPFSNAAADFAKSLRASDANFKSLKIFKCPMANRAVPGAQKEGFWLQTEGALQNPFFGSAMLDCGSEVKP